LFFSNSEATFDNVNIQQLIELNHFESKPGATLLLSLVQGFKANKVIVVGLGDLPNSAKNYIKALTAASGILSSTKTKSAMIAQVDIEDFDESWTHKVSARALKDADYEIQQVGAQEKTDTLENIAIQSTRNDAHELLQGSSIASGMKLTRHLGDLPSNICTPTYLAQTAQDLAKEFDLECEILEESDMSALGMGSLLSVSKGSIEPPKLISLSYKGDANSKPIVLVGKGVTFDTGGISLKPGRNMGDMKYDMGGSAAVVGAMHAIATHELNKNVVGIVGLVENMPDGTAIKPGDVVTSLSGLTVENLNTDAEGRLVLADILTYIQNEYSPTMIVDLATLTGAIVQTLGHEMAGLFTNSTKWGAEIMSAGEHAGEKFFRMPMGENWNKMTDSVIADMQNIGGPFGGSSTAAEFLYRFVDQETAWAHLDIAGMAWNKTPKDTVPLGAVGFGVGTLYSLVKHNTNSDFSIDDSMKY